MKKEKIVVGGGEGRRLVIDRRNSHFSRWDGSIDINISFSFLFILREDPLGYFSEIIVILLGRSLFLCGQ